jgi:hypothetical protein
MCRCGCAKPTASYRVLIACHPSNFPSAEPLPHHFSLTKIRTRYGIEMFRRFFDAIVEQCQEAGLVWGRELYFDGTKVAANAGKESVKPRFAVEAHLSSLFDTEVEEPDDEEEQQIPQEEPAGSDPLVQLPVSLSPTAYEELSQHNEERHDWIEEVGAQDRRVKGRSYQRIADLQVSTTDPDATIMHSKGVVDLGYHTHYVVDGGRARIIVAALVTPSEVMDNQPMLDLLWRTRIRRETVASTRHRGQEVRHRGEPGCHRRPGLVPTFPFLIWITVPSSSVFSRSPMTPSVMCTSLRQAKSSTFFLPIRLNVPVGIELTQKIAITAHSKRNVRPVHEDAASAVVSMKPVWIGCVPISPPQPTKKPWSGSASTWRFAQTSIQHRQTQKCEFVATHELSHLAENIVSLLLPGWSITT